MRKQGEGKGVCVRLGDRALCLLMKKKIGEILIAHKVVSAQDIGGALALQVDGDPNRLGEILVQQGRLEAEALARALAEQQALPYTDLDLVSSAFEQKVPLSFQHRHGLIPFEEPSPGAFCIAVADPLATDVIERVRQWLHAKTIQLYVASADEIERVLNAMEDKELLAGEVLAPAGKSPSLNAKPEASEDISFAFEEEPPSSALSEEDLFGSLKFDEDEQAQAKSVFSPTVQPSAASTEAEELTQIVRRPGPPVALDAASLSTEREITPVSDMALALSDSAPLRELLAELLVEKGTEGLAQLVMGLADVLVSKSLVSREEILDIFALPPVEKW